MSTVPDDADLLREYLAVRDAPCPGCGYNLRGLTTGRCPECAESLELRVALHDPRQAWFIAGLVGLASGAGFSGLLFLYAIIRFALARWQMPPGGFLIVVSASGIIETYLLIAWLRQRRAFQRSSPTLQRLLVVGCWAATLGNVFVFAALIR
jgi:hypothetical protein